MEPMVGSPLIAVSILFIDVTSDCRRNLTEDPESSENSRRTSRVIMVSRKQIGSLPSISCGLKIIG